MDSINKSKKDSFIRVSSFKKSAKKRAVESLFLERLNRKSQNPSLLINFPNKRSNKQAHHSTKNGSYNFSNFNAENNEFLSSIDSLKVKKKKFLEIKK